MKEKKKKDKRKLGAPQIAFQILNTLLVVAILSVYGYRFVKYYQYFEEKAHPEVGMQLKEALINSIDITKTEGLIDNNDGTYTYVGDVENNYVYYSGNYYRIVGINVEGNISLVSTNTLFDCIFNEKNNFVNTVIYKVIYNNYFSYLNDSTYYLNYCDNYPELVNDVTSLSNELVEEDMFIRPLTLQEYQKAKGAKSYLNTNECFWLENYDSDYHRYYVDEQGNVSIAENDNHRLPLKVVFSINGGVTYVSGDGSKDNPYMFTQETTPSKVSECYINQYVLIDGYKFIVSGKDSEKVKLTLASPLQENGEDKLLSYGIRNTYINSDLYNYLHETILSTISDYENKLVKSNFTYTILTDEKEIVYDNNIYKSDECYIGLVDVSDIYLSNDDVLTATLIDGNDRSIIVSKENSYFEDLSKSEHKVQIVIYVKADLTIGSGSGSSSDPFVVK